MAELATRFQFTDPAFAHGISEEFPIDQSTHSLAGAVAVACDVLVQEFGRSFHLPTCCLRVDSVCDPKNLISDQHDFLSQIGHGCRTSTPYSIYGHHGKQVREVIHARDVASFMHAFIDHPRQAEVYNLGAGETQACSLVEAIKLLEDLTGKPLGQDYHEQPAPGEPMIYFCDSRKVKRDYPGWIVTKSLTEMALEVAGRKDCGVHSRD